MSEEFLNKSSELQDTGYKTLKYEEEQKLSWDTLESFNKTVKENSLQLNTVQGDRFEEYDTMNLFELRDALFLDKSGKSKSFRAMYNSVNDLLNLSISKGRFFDEDGNGMTKDFFETLFTAITSVNQYLALHSGYRWQEKGERRVKIATTISFLLNDLTSEVERVQKELPEKKARMIEYAREGLSEEEISEREELFEADRSSSEIMRMATTGDFGPQTDPEKMKEAEKTWILNGYTDDLKELIDNREKENQSGEGDSDSDNDLLAFAVDQNNRLLANRVAISLIIEDSNDSTQGLPWMKEELREYLKKHLSNEQMFTKTTDFVNLVKEKTEGFREENKERLKLIKDRKEMIGTALGLEDNDAGFYDYPIVKELMMGADDREFEERLNGLIENTESNDRIIEDCLNERFSPVTRDAVKGRLLKFLGALRVFSGADRVYDQVNVFIDMQKYTAPAEFVTEKSITNMMKDLKIDSIRRDHFVNYLTDNKPAELMRLPMEFWSKKAEAYANNLKANAKSYAKRVDKKGRYLTKNQWDEIERINLESGGIRNSDFKERLEAVMASSNTGETLSRKEYLTKRKFEDAKKEPQRLRRAAAEQALIEKMGDSMEKCFYLQLASDGTDPYEDYRVLDSAYKGTSVRLKAEKEEEEERKNTRLKSLRKLLEKEGVKEELRPAYEKKFDRILRGIRETTPDMTDDERLHTQRLNLEQFGVISFEQALLKIGVIAADLQEGRLETDGSLKDGGYLSGLKDHYDKSLDRLKKYDGGKYGEFAEILLKIPGVFSAVMHREGEELDVWISENLDGALSPFLEGVKLAGKQGDKYVIPSAVRKQYIFSYIRNIYDGTLKGDAEFFKNQLINYNDKVFMIKPDGQHSISDNIKSAEKLLDKLIKKKGKVRSEALGLKIAVLAKIYDKANDTGEFLKLMDRDSLLKFAEDELDRVIASVQEDKDSSEVSKNIVTAFTDRLPDPDEAVEKKKSEVIRYRERGIKDRYNYLGIDEAVLQDIRMDKSLVRVAKKGVRRIKLGSSKPDEMRGRIQKYCSSFELPRVLNDALVEEGSSEAFTDRVKGIMWDANLLQRHAFSMNKLFKLLTRDFKDDTAMSEEEAQMYIISLYGNPKMRSLFENEGGPDVASLRASDSYRLFRKNYELLTELEAEESEDQTIERERMEVSKNLRTMFISGEGILGLEKDEASDAESDFKERQKKTGEIIEKHIEYLKRCDRLSSLIRKQIDAEEEEKEVKYSSHFKSRKALAARDYFTSGLVSELKAGKDFDEKEWNERIKRAYDDKDIWENLLFNRNSISGEAYAKAEKHKGGNEVTEGDIAYVIKENTFLFKGNVNKYEKLDEDQKKLFSLGLMLMEKGAIGYGAGGSIDLINSGNIRGKNLEKIKSELNKYLKGQAFDIDIDYKEAYNKLVNFGETNFFYMESHVMSKTAFDKALQFVNALQAKKTAMMEKDSERLNNGYESINTAFVKYGKEDQLNEVDKIRDESLSMEDVKNKLLEYAERDSLSLSEITKNALKKYGPTPPVAIAFDRDVARNRKIGRIKERLEKMSPSDLKLFVRIMQERGVLDKSSADPGDGSELFTEHEKRNALCEALAADAETRGAVLESFDDSESCSQVIINALSFQLRDDVELKGKDLTEDHFAPDALKRKTLADWDLLERAFEFLDEVKERRSAIYALSHASDFIEQSGNEKAIEENKYLEKSFKKKEDYTEAHFERSIKEQAEKDGEPDIKRAVSGYHTLSEREKALFFTVLKRRDLLDISRKDYKKSFFGIADRNYVNQAERDKLLDRYIESSLEDNVGLKIPAGAHFDAMKMLLSTQISDREKFDSDKSLDKMTVVERNLFMGRSTAVDWKLFKRALNFVLRAREELEYTEGNAQLYRGAGDLAANGRLDISYKFLRKNFHKTGNQWGRYVGRLFVRTAKEVVKVDALDAVLNGLDVLDLGAQKLFRLKKDGLTRSGIAWLKKKASNLGTVENQAKNLDSGGFKVQDIKEKKKNKAGEKDPGAGKEAKEEIKEEETEEKPVEHIDEETEESREITDSEKTEHTETDLTGGITGEADFNEEYLKKVSEGIDDIFACKKSATQALQNVKKLLKDSFSLPLMGYFESIEGFLPADEVKAKADKKNLVQAQTANTQADTSYGDSRDTMNEWAGYGKTGLKVWYSTKLNPVTKYVTDLVGYATQKAVFGFISEKVMKLENGDGGTDKKELKKEAEEYASRVYKKLLESTIGEQNAKNLLSFEKNFHDFMKPVSDGITSAVQGIDYAKKCVNHIQGISNAIKNMSLLSKGEESAAKRRKKDDEKLKKASEKRLSKEQAEKAKEVVEKHRGMSDLSDDIANAIQEFNIGGELVNFAIDTANIAGGKLDMGVRAITKAVKEGLQFAMYALRVASDRNSLAGYYINTDAGRKVVDKVREGFIRSGDKALAEELDSAIDTQRKMGVSSLVDIISDARGYEHTSELVENTAMSMAQSIVFCASDYNPMAETKLMAITVMTVMGLSKEIGSNAPETVEKLFKAFSMAR